MPILDGSDDGEFYTEDDNHSGETDCYPTEWAPVKDVYGIEYRHLSSSMYQLRSLTHIVAVSQEGFITYIRDPINVDEFEQWCKDNNIEIKERKP